MKAIGLRIEKDLFQNIVDHCETRLILPRDLVRLSVGEPPREPFLLSVKSLESKDQTKRMVSVLFELWESNPVLFDLAAEGVGGHSRKWFGKSREEITATGNSNSARRVGSSPWWVSDNCPYNGKGSRVEKVMLKMGFSWEYAWLVASWVQYGRGRLTGRDFCELP